MRRAHLLVLATLVAPTLAVAQSTPAYPARPVRIVVPFPAGGPGDLVGRAIAQRLTDAWGQPVLIDNRGGAGGSIGMEVVVRALPDGYTLGVGSVGSLVLSPAVDPKLRYDPTRDVTPIALVAATQYVLAVHPSVPAKSVQDLLRLAREKKGRLNYASSGVGSISHMLTELIQSAAGVEMVHIAYKGTGPAITALLGGEIDLCFVAVSSADEPAKAGRLRLLAASGARRVEAMRHLPTLIEAGLKMPPVEGSYGLVGPAGLPRDVVTRINTSVNAALKTPEFRGRLEQQGFEPVPVSTPEDYAKQLRDGVEVFRQVVKRSGIKPDA
ncbi:MAG: tripartite tricarboxylate transporter substrate binding protein [Proteobacteria bacterium]|nr:tripartite tricarboxylate transporter substrate binding protein [Burkholderiales bacterium]